MESLLRLSGLLPEDLDGKTDLGDLERRLTEQTKVGQSARHSTVVSTTGRSSSESVRTGSSTLQSTAGSPTPSREKDEDQVENLSDLMCSLVTNNCGETRFIGNMLLSGSVLFNSNDFKVHPLDSRYSAQRAFSGLTRRPATQVFKK